MAGDPRRWQIGLVGYGEVGRILAEDLRQQDIRVTAYDIKLGGEQGGSLILRQALSFELLTQRRQFIVDAVSLA
jgi:phosphoglycerate dehydrogenase-like enzyme